MDPSLILRALAARHVALHQWTYTKRFCSKKSTTRSALVTGGALDRGSLAWARCRGQLAVRPWEEWVSWRPDSPAEAPHASG
ncbi:hypothetical protein CHLRE_06g260976v5 [Chlamydomonas reinhardtii]|uniref:Uncharacterized protein n=1 Tax=Chlamydomonas reinhardtii TaxID=3055 RepID=A0A2K3DMN2_CHLRE|nr:uncharacterized protein CHLRE_06g260976v5 [Chlamydomonas reinhardtii]PNW81804.1 hypothetical protein CHLRE_06g260976v5 [Chlamydomonas reinhardtii]